MALFEHVIMLKQDLSTADLDGELKKHTDLLSELSGSIVYKETWGLRNLAYPIKNNKKAFYEFMNIEIPEKNLNALNLKLNLNENIIRYLSIKVKSSKVNINSRICSARSGFDSSIVERILVSEALSIALRISATGATPPTLVTILPACFISSVKTSLSSLTTPGGILSNEAIR